ncbi:MAG: zinc-ribbon domain-containing protein [Deltaproteobacteria bacterium]|nr:zinc-ribbon domain-containing protein [Deltaproteobacteria bacterium]
MNVVCEKCQSKFQIPSQKVPKGQAFSVICPKCSNKVPNQNPYQIKPTLRKSIPALTTLRKNLLILLNKAWKRPFCANRIRPSGQKS